MARDKRGRFLAGHDNARHQFTDAERSRGGQAAWVDMMENRPAFLKWLQERINRTARPATLAAYKARKRKGRVARE